MPDNWLRSPDPWEIARPNEKVEVNIGCSFELSGGSLRPVPGRPSTLIGIPFDRPVIGYGGSTINTLRLLEEYFLVACSLADAVHRFRRSNSDWNSFPEKVAVQMNDTHPSLAVPE